MITCKHCNKKLTLVEGRWVDEWYPNMGIDMGSICLENIPIGKEAYNTHLPSDHLALLLIEKGVR